MKKLISSLLIALMFSFTTWATHNYDSTAVSYTVKMNTVPNNVVTYDLNTPSTNETKDTLLTTRANFYGPYGLAQANGPMFNYLVIRGDVITGTTPEMGVFIAVTKGVKMADTVAFDSVCALGTTALNCKVDLASYAGKSIVIKVRNHDGSTSSIPGYFGISLKYNVSTLLK